MMSFSTRCPFSFDADSLVVNNLGLTVPTAFAFSTNSVGQIDRWDISVTGHANFTDGPVVIIRTFSNLAFVLGEDAEDDVSSNDTLLGEPGELENLNMPGTWAIASSTGVPEPASGTLLIAGLVGLAGLALKKSL
jgi:hypothetical protein